MDTRQAGIFMLAAALLLGGCRVEERTEVRPGETERTERVEPINPQDLDITWDTQRVEVPRIETRDTAPRRP